MTRQKLLELFSQLLRDLLGDESITLGMDTHREQVAGWDSFNYVNFIVAVEMQIGVRFGVAEVESFQNVGEIVDRALAILGAAR